MEKWENGWGKEEQHQHQFHRLSKEIELHLRWDLSIPAKLLESSSELLGLVSEAHEKLDLKEAWLQSFSLCFGWIISMNEWLFHLAFIWTIRFFILVKYPSFISSQFLFPNLWKLASDEKTCFDLRLSPELKKERWSVSEGETRDFSIPELLLSWISFGLFGVKSWKKEMMEYDNCWFFRWLEGLRGQLLSVTSNELLYSLWFSWTIPNK